MATADPVFESLQRLSSMMDSFDESLSQFCKDNRSESAFDQRKNLREYYQDLHKALQSMYETLKIKEKKTEEPGTGGKNKENKISKVTGSSPASSPFSKVLPSVKVRHEIKTLCDKGDGSGLINYIVDNMKEAIVDSMKEAETLQNEVLVAFSKAPDAAKLVIKALESCDISKSGFSLRERNWSLTSAESLSFAYGKACNLLLESLYPVFGNDDSDVVPSEVKDSAREIAKVWRKGIRSKKNEDSDGTMDVQPFLHLLATFRLAAEYEKDELLRLVCIILRRKQTPELCRSLGLSSKVPDLVHKRFRSKPKLALRYAHVCGVMDKIDPVDLLTSYLRGVEEGAKVLLTNGHCSAGSQNAANGKMLSALKLVIELIKEYGLESDFCEDELQNKLRILVQEKENFEKKSKQGAKRKVQEKEDGEKAAEKKAQGTENRNKATERRLQHKGHRSFEPAYGPSEKENYASKRAKHTRSKRAKHASPNKTIRVAGGMGNSKASPYNIDGVQKKSGIIGHDHHTSAFSAANRSSTGLAAGAFTSTPSIAAQIIDERRHHPSAFGTSNLTPIGSSSLYGSSVPVGAFAVPLHNVAEVNYEGRGQQSYTMNPGEVDKNHVRASVYGTGDLTKSSATRSNYNYEGISQQSYKFNFGEVDKNYVGTSAYGTGVLANSSATHAPYDRRGPEHYTSAFSGGNMGSIGSSVYGSNSRTIPSSDVRQGGQERSFGHYSGFAGRNMIPTESSGYGHGVSTVPPSNVNQGHFESGSVIDKYKFNSGLTSLRPAY